MKTSNYIKTFFGAGVFLFLATFIVNVANYGLNLFLARWLGPEGFSEANILATLVMTLSFIAMGLQLTVTKIVAEGKVELVRNIIYRTKNVSLAIGLGLIVLSPLLAGFFNFASPRSLIILFLGLPCYFVMSIWRGYYQGKVDFRKLGMTYLTEMVIRVFVTIGLLYYFSQYSYSSEIISIGFLLSFFITNQYFKNDQALSAYVDKKPSKEILSFLFVIGSYELSQILINNSDVILVKHFFSAYEAGQYASLAILGRAVFFATWTIVTILFPKVIEKEKAGEPHLRLFWQALGIVAGIGSILVAGTYFFGAEIISLAFGPSYASISSYLYIYTLSTALFACGNVFVYYYLSLGKYTPVVLSILAGLLQIIAIAIWHFDIMQILIVQLVCMSLFLFSVIFYQFLNGVRIQYRSVYKEPTLVKLSK